MSKTSKKRRNVKRKPKRRENANSEYGTIIRIRNNAADTLDVVLFYQDTNQIRSSTTSICSWRYRTNSVYDPDPNLSTGALAGFTEWSAFYNRYRVIEFGYDVQIANLESFPLMIMCGPTVNDIGANATFIDQLPENPYGKKSLISAMGGMDRCRLKGNIDLARFVGSKTLFNSDNFASTVLTNPNNLLWFNIGYATGGPATTKGVFVSVRLRYRVLMYARVELNG